jgi:hypothetical protein
VRAVTAADLLDAWEAGWDRTPLERAVAMLAADGGHDPASVTALTVGRRDRDLFALRAALLGPAVDAVATCPECGTEVEIAFDQNDLLAGVPAAPTAALAVGSARVRLPTSADLAAALPAEDPVRALVRRCVEPPGDGVPVDPADMDTDLTDAAVAAAWSAADPITDITLDLSCPDCARPWQEPFDIVSFLWTELDLWCRRTLLDVHDLASAYGWSEAAVLALSPWRRQCYLDLVGS